MIVQFWSGFSKRENSTKLPKAEDATIVSNVQLKDECSFMNPVLRIDGNNLVSGAAFSPSIYNYCYINYWERFYFIRDWRWVNGLWECELAVDVLASFKSQIGDTEAYIVRSEAEYNGGVQDLFYPTVTDINISTQNIDSNLYGVALSSGCFVVGIINKLSSNKFGAITYYALTSAQMASFEAYLFSGNIFNSSGIDEISEGLFKSIFDPFQYVKTCMWFPFPTTTFGSTTAEIEVGYWGTGVNGTICSTLIEDYRVVTQSKILDHPQLSRGSYLNKAPYTTVTAYIPPFGEIPIDTNFCQFANNWLYGRIIIDFITGIAELRLAITPSYDDTAPGFDALKLVTTRTAQVGVSVQLSQVLTDYLGIVGSAGSIITSYASENYAGMISGVGSTTSDIFPKARTMGTNGSLAYLSSQPVLVVEHRLLVNENMAEWGRPLMSVRKINTLTGYIQCGEDDHPFTGTEQERVKINNFMKNGFFYE